MRKTIRQKIVDAVKERLKTITVENGYNTNIGLNVTHWKQNPFEVRNLPCIEVRDTGDAQADLSFGLALNTITLEVYIYHHGDNADEVIRQAIADVRVCIGADVTWGGLAEDTLQATDVEDIQVEHQGRKIFGAMMRYSIEYVSERWNPYE